MKNYLYKIVINNVTDLCYDNSLNFFPEGSRILDVGIGNGLMLRKYHGLIKTKKLSIVGIDINKDYLCHCRDLIKTCNLEDHINIHYSPVEHYEPPRKEYFDYILFSMSFMLFKDQGLVLDRIKSWIKPDGKILFFQTMFQDRSSFMEFIKPKLKYFTTVDFGRVTYDDSFFDLLKKNKLSVVEDRLLKREWFKGEYRLIISNVENGKATDKTIHMSDINPSYIRSYSSTKTQRISGITKH